MLISVADPDFELVVVGGGGGFVLLALQAFLPLVISSFFTESKGGPFPRSATGFLDEEYLSLRLL